MLTELLDIEKLIPHRDRMKLIDKVLDVDAERAVTSSRVTDRWPLCQGSFVDPVILIELVAQTAGIHISWKRGVDKGVGNLGWLVGIKNAAFFHDQIPLYTELVTTVKNLYNAENYNVLEGTVLNGEELLCRVQIQVFRADTD